jgi:hypothetical protein
VFALFIGNIGHGLSPADTNRTCHAVNNVGKKKPIW